MNMGVSVSDMGTHNVCLCCASLAALRSCEHHRTYHKLCELELCITKALSGYSRDDKMLERFLDAFRCMCSIYINTFFLCLIGIVNTNRDHPKITYRALDSDG